ncbi:MAG: J domain-containing protein [Phototrophicaceae bacterium]
MHHEPEHEKKDRLDIEEVILNPYDILGIEQTASDKDIKKAYFAKVREHPPESDAQQFKRIRAAYDMIRTPGARSATDLFLLKSPISYQPYKRPPTFSLEATEQDKQRVLKADTDLMRIDFEDDFRDIRL